MDGVDYSKATPRDILHAASRVAAVRSAQRRNEVFWLECSYDVKDHKDGVRAYMLDLGILADHFCAMLEEKGLI